MTKKTWIFALVLGIVSASLVARAIPVTQPGGGPQAAGDSTSGSSPVTIDNFSFSPVALTVAAGTTVKWTNHDDIPHTVTERDHKFKSKALDTDDTFSHTFDEPGTYEYFCSLHPKMTAKVVVQAKR
jgi:plastocyanin